MDPLDPLEAAMMTGELIVSPVHVAAVLIACPPGDAGPGYVGDVYSDGLTATDQVDPRLRRYPHRGVDTGGVWVWREAEKVDLSEHIQRRSLPLGAGRGELWRLIGELHAEHLDPSRPMWMACLIDGLDDGRFAFYVKVHHTVVDGVEGFQMIADSLTTDPARRSMPAFYAARADQPADRSAGALPNPVSLLRSAIGAAVSGVGLGERVVKAELSNLLASLTKDTVVPPVGAPYTRFNGRLGRGRAVAAASLPKTRIRTLQTAAGVTGNDVVTAVVAGVLREWLLAHDELPEKSLVACCPITVRSREHAGKDEHGNMFGLWLCPLGTDLDDPAERLSLIHRSMEEGKRQVAERGSGASMLLVAPSIAPTLLLGMLPVVPKLRTGYNLPISNVPGPCDAMYWNGAHVEEIYPVSIAFDGMGLNVTMCSYADRVGFGYVTGREMMPDIETVMPLTESCLTKLEGAVAGRS